MADDKLAEAKHIYDEWDAASSADDLDRVMALYADDAVIESPAVLANYPDLEDGVLRGKEKIRAHFEKTRADTNTIPRKRYRPIHFFSDGQYLTWEYPRLAPQGPQTDLFESMDIKNGLIVHHRVYWGWLGFKKLRSALLAGNP